MTPLVPPIDTRGIEAFIAAVGKKAWAGRIAGLLDAGSARTHSGRQVLQNNCIELALERLRVKTPGRLPTTSERRIAACAAETVQILGRLSPQGQEALRALLRAGIEAGSNLVSVFHLVRTAGMQQARGFGVRFAGLEEGAGFDLLIERSGVEAEVACEVMSAEIGRCVNRGAWFSLVDRVDPELQTWLRAHPGRYLLKMTLPRGLEHDPELLARLHTRITQMLAVRGRNDGDEAAMLRLDPLMLAAAQSDETGLMPRLRREFGPEAHLSVTAAANGIFVMAARGGRENAVAVAMRQRLAAVAPARLTGTRPGILSLFLEDTDRAEWRGLRDKLELEGEARQFMTTPEARSVVAVTCTTRLELFGLAEPDACPGGEMRFRNPAHPSAKLEALGPAIQSSM